MRLGLRQRERARRELGRAPVGRKIPVQVDAAHAVFIEATVAIVVEALCHEPVAGTFGGATPYAYHAARVG